MLIFMPPVLSPAAPTSMPSTLSSACVRLPKRSFDSSWRVSTVIEAGACLMSCSKPEAETTTSGMLTGAPVWACAGRQDRAAKARARVVGRGRRARRVLLDMQTPEGG
ncbi:hypothetical protein D3C81_1482170 [compost metagenome]